MKKYRSLKTVFHQYSVTEAENEASRRRALGFETSFKLGGHLLFYAATPQLLLLQEQVLSNERTLELFARNIPLAAQRGYLFDLITKEIAATNEIEGVRSTRQEIIEALESEPHENKRFGEIARLYRQLSDGSLEPPGSLEEIRSTYDDVFGREIAADDAPDGDLFRAGPVWVRDGAGQPIHAGAKAEEEIISQLEAMFEHLVDDEVPFILSRVVSHFMFEAVHPFYDGNGRFGRFLLSAQLQEVFSAYTVLTLSYMINQQKDKYYKAFTDVEAPQNFGDVTLFAHVMLGLLRDAQLHLIEDFRAKNSTMEALGQRMSVLELTPGQLTKAAVGALYVFGQVHLFGGGASLEWNTLAEVLGKSPNTVRKYIAELESAGLVERTSSRPLRLVLSEQGRQLLSL